ncbi:hypothetical protein B0H16DRAFT_1640561 [Mycena metata]|uniref:Uncharacterized protein n=1 Tax=Mycena metata TaxID=1033252 RepID=A0AAD7DZT8_9AGAR|nr:hypothetical protein B0H16DRAFT_1640561 [Mycena metata]
MCINWRLPQRTVHYTSYTTSRPTQRTPGNIGGGEDERPVCDSGLRHAAKVNHNVGGCEDATNGGRPAVSQRNLAYTLYFRMCRGTYLPSAMLEAHAQCTSVARRCGKVALLQPHRRSLIPPRYAYIQRAPQDGRVCGHKPALSPTEPAETLSLQVSLGNSATRKRKGRRVRLVAGVSTKIVEHGGKEVVANHAAFVILSCLLERRYAL